MSQLSISVCYLPTVTGVTVLKNAHFGQGTGPVHLNNIRCSGSEIRLTDCAAEQELQQCTHENDAGVTCDG